MKVRFLPGDPNSEAEMSKVAIMETERGFHKYGESIEDSYRATIRVQESSAASGPHCWVFVEGGRIENNEGAAHLTEDQAKALIERLQAWVDEIPTRWSSESEQEDR